MGFSKISLHRRPLSVDIFCQEMKYFKGTPFLSEQSLGGKHRTAAGTSVKAEKVKLEGPERRSSSSEGSRAELGQFLARHENPVLRRSRGKRHFLPTPLIQNPLSV